MIVKALELEQFRNYVRFQAEFHPRVNLIYGENAQGKTNLLEAIAYLSSARSHRARYDREMIRLEGEEALIRGAVESRRREFLLEARLARGRRRQLASNGVRLKTAGELSGILNTVLFCPEDLMLIREGAAARRHFLDCAICQLRPRYAQALAEYNRLYEHKTRILRDWPDNPSLLETLEDFNVRMAQMGALVIRYRAYFVRRLQEAAPAVHRDFSGGREELSLTYQTVSSVSDPTAAPQKILEQLRDHQERHRQAELDSRQCLSGPHKDDLLVELDGRSAKTYGSQKILEQLRDHQERHRQAELDSRQCLSGPHKDDLLVELDGRSAKTYGSQGQTRTAALSLKLAQRDIFFQETGEYPVLLLDDVLSELDVRRQAFVLNHIQGGQIFITCCEEEKLEGLEGGAAFHIHGGALV